MNIVSADIDNYVTNYVGLQSLANLLFVNKFFNKIVSTKPVMTQWKTIASAKNKTTDKKFVRACAKGFLEYATYLINENTIDIHAYGEGAFICSCSRGKIDVAKWLIYLGESDGYTRINIHANNEYAFRHSCQKGRIDIAKWLVCLGDPMAIPRLIFMLIMNMHFDIVV